MSVDLIVTGGDVVTDGDRYRADVLVDDGTIVGITEQATVSADETIDATGKVILPGLVNTHVHFREPGQTHKEDFTTGSKAAAAGGYTMFLDMPNCTPVTNTLERYEEKLAIAEEKAIIDYNSWAGATDPDAVTEIYENTGNLGFKIFMHRHPTVEFPYVPELAIYETDELHAIFESIAAADPQIPVSIHPSDVPLADAFFEQLTEMGANDYSALRDGKDGMNMTLGAYEAAFLARLSGLEKLNILHLGFNERTPDPWLEFENRETLIDLVRMLKDNDWELYGEAEGSTLLQRDEEISWDRRWYTPDQEKIWEAIHDGVIDTLLIEHAPQQREEAAVDDVWDAASGLISAQDFLPLILTAVNEGKLSLPKLVELTATNPAQFLGIYPRKGAIRVGSDADLTIVDVDREHVIDGSQNFGKCDWSSFDGYEVTGAPTQTVVRGTVVYDEGEILVDPGFGKYISKHEYR